MSENGKKNFYFLSDFHLGIPDHESSLIREKIIIRWMDAVKEDAKEIYLLGDIFDFWFEYSKVVPKGYVRILAKIAELVDIGINVHLFRGNHDIWEFNYLKEEIGIIYHSDPETIMIGNKNVHLGHGHGLGPDDIFYKLLLRIFDGKVNQFIFKWLHPDIGVRIGLLLSDKHRYIKRLERGKDVEIILENELLYKYAVKKSAEAPDIDYFIFGHRHVPVFADMPDSKAKIVILGDWMTHFTYAKIDENGAITLNKFEDIKN
ncbi:MAG: UDP-2,3-diacylglucosamine diphosphatase [Bacteroidales bacterium]|nr:UDP-2,3-diacylglucosamine diphosphatase [Bacteroidales bacterium]